MDDLCNSPLESALLEALKRRLSASRLTQRQVERELRLGHGTFGNVLQGRTALKVRHLELFGAVLGFTPVDILREALGGLDLPEAPGPDDGYARRIATHVVDELLRRPLAIVEKL